MKKIILILCLLAYTLPVFAEIEPPSWSEFCPPQFCNAEYDDYKEINYFLKFILSISIVGIPYVSHNSNKAVYAYCKNYWTNRRELFSEAVEKCNSVKTENEKIYCYSAIRQTELARNQERREQINQFYIQKQMNVIQNQNRYNQNQINNVNNYIKYGY